MKKVRITANYATYKDPARLKALRQSVESIIDQVDLVRIRYNGSINDRHMFNGLEQMEKVEFYVGEDLTDLGKFFGLSFLKNEYYFCCDDKIIYPPEYVMHTVKMIDKHQCIVTYHGRVLVKDEMFYKGKHRFIKYNRELTSDCLVDVPGTGVTAFKTDYFCPAEIIDSPHHKMADLVFGLMARQEKKRIVCLKRSAGWIKSINLPGIWHEFNEGPKAKPETEQVNLMKQIFNYGK